MKYIWQYALIGAIFITTSAQNQSNTSPSIDAGQLLQSIQRDLQDPRYPLDILPNNFSYLTQLLSYGAQTKQSHDFAQNAFGLFSKMLKGSEYVNAYVLNAFLQQMPSMLKHYFATPQLESANQRMVMHDLDMLERLQKTVSTLVYTKFSNDFETCKTDPQGFLNDLSEKIMSATAQEVSMEQLRQIVIRFLEICINKLIWNPKEEEKTWALALEISQHIAALREYNIIEDVNDVDELFWSLVHRYRYFLDLNHSSMSFAFYRKVKRDIRTKKLMLFELEEQEPFLQTKSSCLLKTVLAQENKKRAMKHERRVV